MSERVPVTFRWADLNAEKRVFELGAQVLREGLSRLPIGEASEIAWQSNQMMEQRELVIRRGPRSTDGEFDTRHPRFMQFVVLAYNDDGRSVIGDAESVYVQRLVQASIEQVLNAH